MEDFDLSIFDKKTQRKIIKRVYTIASAKAKKLVQLKGAANSKTISKPFFKTKLHDKTLGVFGARQNPVNDKFFTDLPTASRMPCDPHPIKLDSGRWIYTKTHSDNRCYLYDVRFADTGEDVEQHEYTFFYSKNRQIVLAARRKRPYTIRPLETDFAAPDLISNDDWERILQESFEEAAEEFK